MNGVAIKREPKLPHPPADHVGVKIAGTRMSVPIMHVSRETLNKPGLAVNLGRAERRARRKARMRLRKLRGWH
jgi:hypothetical protein